MYRNSRKPILLNLDKDLVEKIDIAVREFYHTRTNFLRESAKRNLRYYENQERPVAVRLKQNLDKVVG